MPKGKPRMERQLSFGVMTENSQISVTELESPSGYRGFYRFHKYWGKKPYEPLAYVIEQLTEPGDVVLDPFCGLVPRAAKPCCVRGGLLVLTLTPQRSN